MKAARLSEELLEQYITAGSTQARPEQLRVLAEHFCEKIRLRVAENPATPPELLWNLAHDSNNDVRVAVGCNPSSDGSVLNLLIRDTDVVVRHGLAQNIHTPRTILEVLTKDENGWVCGEALKSLAIIDSKSDDEVGKRRRLKRTRGRNKCTSEGDEQTDSPSSVAS